MGEQNQWDAGVEAAWTVFRGCGWPTRWRRSGDDRLIEVELDSRLGDEEQHGAAPYDQFIGWGGDLVRAEAVSNVYLDVSYALEVEAYDQMLGMVYVDLAERLGEDLITADEWLRARGCILSASSEHPEPLKSASHRRIVESSRKGDGDMQARVGDRLIVESRKVETPRREGEILEVRGKAGGPPYVVRWSDGHEGVTYPGPDAHVAPAELKS